MFGAIVLRRPFTPTAECIQRHRTGCPAVITSVISVEQLRQRHAVSTRVCPCDVLAGAVLVSWPVGTDATINHNLCSIMTVEPPVEPAVERPPARVRKRILFTEPFPVSSPFPYSID